MSFSSANGARVVTASVAIPLYGTWTADVMLADPQALTGPVTLVLGNLVLVGAVYRQGTFGGVQNARLVGGAGGWLRTIPAQAYASPAGVLLSTVLRDAAALVGETVQIAADAPLGSFYVREQAPAQRLLRLLAGDSWWMDPTGTTRIGSRPSAAIASPFLVESFDAGRGELVVSTEDYAAWMPGATFTAPQLAGVQTVSFARFASDNDGRLRLSVLVSP